ncbi:uncharacterized protein DNG_00510 [Cephalotrichum gorgonifer]|uniref:Uncharacterized protein n=1 Tax=Cephalotrichum gorgonifer TaxID=2041049 RepID=A0AAE8MQ31_9PEZI|nr:uncharacterized protein DNG_00510 [Cephalotrichum gorgonifer]
MFLLDSPWPLDLARSTQLKSVGLVAVSGTTWTMAGIRGTEICSPEFITTSLLIPTWVLSIASPGHRPKIVVLGGGGDCMGDRNMPPHESHSLLHVTSNPLFVPKSMRTPSRMDRIPKRLIPRRILHATVRILMPRTIRRKTGVTVGTMGDLGTYYGNYRNVRNNYSNQENVPPSRIQAPQRAAPPSRIPSGTLNGITQAHRRVQDMMKTWIPRGRGQKGDRDGAAIHISRPIPLAAPHPISSNTGHRLAENVLSIDDDDMLPAGLRNLHLGSSNPSEVDGGALERVNSRSQAPSRLDQGRDQRDEASQKPDAPGISREARGGEEPSKVRFYAPPRKLSFEEPVRLRGRTPYPAETLTELECRGIIRAQPKQQDSDEDSRSVIRADHGKWRSTKARLGNAKEGVFARLGIKSKRVREAEELGYSLLTRRAMEALRTSGDSGDALTDLDDHKRRMIEQWRQRVSNGDIDDEADALRNEMDGHRSNMTTSAGHAVVCPGFRERLTHLKEKAFRSRPELREGM